MERGSRASFDGLVDEDYEDYNADAFRAGLKNDLRATTHPRASSNTEPETESNLPSGYCVRFSSCKALSAIVGNRAVNNGATIDALPCVEDQKKV